MRKNISEIGHKWRWAGEYIVLDIHNSNFHAGTHSYDSPKYCKVMSLSDGTPYIRYNGITWLVKED